MKTKEKVCIVIVLVLLGLLFATGCRTTTGDTAVEVGTIYAAVNGYGAEAVVVSGLMEEAEEVVLDDLEEGLD